MRVLVRQREVLEEKDGPKDELLWLGLRLLTGYEDFSPTIRRSRVAWDSPGRQGLAEANSLAAIGWSRSRLPLPKLPTSRGLKIPIFLETMRHRAF